MLPKLDRLLWREGITEVSPNNFELTSLSMPGHTRLTIMVRAFCDPGSERRFLQFYLRTGSHLSPEQALLKLGNCKISWSCMAQYAAGNCAGDLKKKPFVIIKKRSPKAPFFTMPS